MEILVRTKVVKDRPCARGWRKKWQIGIYTVKSSFCSAHIIIIIIIIILNLYNFINLLVAQRLYAVATTCKK